MRSMNRLEMRYDIWK